MAELNSKLHCKKDGVTEEITAYTTLEEVQNQGISIKVDNLGAYVKYDIYDKDLSSALQCKVNNELYYVSKTAIPMSVVMLLCYDIETNTQITSVPGRFPQEKGVYVNNENAPVVSGYDFVGMEGVRHSNLQDGDAFKLYYIRSEVPDRSRTDWSYYSLEHGGAFGSSILYLNTYSATDMVYMFSGIDSLTTVPLLNTSNVNYMDGMFQSCMYLETIPQFDTSNVVSMDGMFQSCYSLETIPQFDTSNVTDMGSMFLACVSLTSVPKLDTSKVRNFASTFEYCSELTSIDWEIDMSSCVSCYNMFNECYATNIRLKNVPSTLDLSEIGTTNYVVVNYI